ncbi:aspartic endopeptidase Pep2, partial [Aphelenchoides avenae]
MPLRDPLLEPDCGSTQSPPPTPTPTFPATSRRHTRGTFLSAAKTTTQDINEQEGNFMVNVGIGTPPQNFRLLVQHDRTDTYVLSKDCDTGVCPDHAKFDGSKSTTYTGHPKDKKCCAGTLTNTGTTAAGFAFPAKDNIVLGDVSIRQATFAVVVNNSADRNERESIHFDGVLGLGLPDPNQATTNPFTVSVLTTALEQRAIDKTMYTVWLQRQDGGDCEQSKAFLPTLGDVNKNACDASSINWHTLTHTYTSTSYGFGWVIDYATNVDQIIYGDHVYTLDNKTAWAAKFAPQSEAVLRAPSTITDDFAKRVGATIVDTYPGRFYPVDCKVRIPDDVKIVMDSKEYVIPGKRLINRLYYPRSCSLNLVASSPPYNYYEFIIGSPFLREYCQTYDAGNDRIGFSKNTDAREMDTQNVCSGATTLSGL